MNTTGPSPGPAEGNGSPLLAHFHIFKNGGSTLDWILRRNFGKDFREFHAAMPSATLRAADLRDFLREHPAIKAVSSHHLRLPLDVKFDRPVLALCFLRHPLDRIASLFEHERRQPGISPADPRFSALKPWVEHGLAARRHLICDAQTMFLATGATYYDPPSLVEVGLAQEALANLPFCGVVDEFDRSMVLLESIVQAWLPRFDATYFPQNVSRGRGAALEERLAAITAELGETLADQVTMNNLYDLKLLGIAREKLARALAGLPDGTQRLDGLRARNQRLS